MNRARALIWLAAMLLPAACTAAHASAPPVGTVTGRLVIEGGPIGLPPIRPLPGTVRFTGGPDGPVTVRTNSAGVFSVRLPPGRYRVSDRSPRLVLVTINGTSHLEWSVPVSVTVTAHHTTRITLASIVP
jgi:hypothetical protein